MCWYLFEKCVNKRRKKKSQDSVRFRLGSSQDLCVCVEQETSQGEGQVGDAGGDSVRKTGL